MIELRCQTITKRCTARFPQAPIGALLQMIAGARRIGNLNTELRSIKRVVTEQCDSDV